MMTMNSAAMKLKKNGSGVYYASRALPSLKAKLALGEDYLDPIFLMVLTMLVAALAPTIKCCPPICARLRARHFRAWQHTTAKVTVSQMGRVILRNAGSGWTVSGIRDLGDSVSGTLHIRIEEQNGQCRNMTSAPPRCHTSLVQVRFAKIAMGRPQEWGDTMSKANFSGAEASPGSLTAGRYMAALGDENYQSAALGVGRDLSTFGAVAFDVTHSHTKLIKTPLMAKVRWTVTPSV